MIAKLLGQRVYLDANVFIYSVEGYPKYSALCSQILTAVEKGSLAAVTSELSLAEVMGGPLRKNQADIVALYKELLQDSDSLQVAQVSRSVLIAAAEIRAANGGKLPDAIHAATATQTACRHFVTGDRSIKLPSRTELMKLDDLLSPQ
jgi:predicted nucleic acid-binding protein